MELQEYSNSVGQLQAKLSRLPQRDLPTCHSFAPGVYVRELLIDKDVLVIGKTHKTEHLNMVVQGDCLVACDGKVQRMVAPYTFISKAGAKKVIYAIEETVWATIHPTEETDLDLLEEELIDMKAEEDIEKLAEIQNDLLIRAQDLLKEDV